MAKHRDCQEKLRAEIEETTAKIRERGDTDFTGDDFESMPYLTSVTKVRSEYLFVPLNDGETHQIFA